MEKLTPEEITEFNPNFKPLHRGVWADKLTPGQELPMGGSLFSNDLTLKLKLDFNAFEQQIDKFNEQNIKLVWEKSKDNVLEWLNQIGSNIDPYTYFVCYQVQKKMQTLLKVNYDSKDFVRKEIYSKEPPMLSELKGTTACGEQAALSQFLMQRSGLESSYVSGITMNNALDEDEFPEEHSFLSLPHPVKADKGLIFDVARPLTANHDIPRVIETAVPFTYDLLKNKEDFLVEGKDVLQGEKLYFGVGAPVAGKHEWIGEKQLNNNF